MKRSVRLDDRRRELAEYRNEKPAYLREAYDLYRQRICFCKSDRPMLCRACQTALDEDQFDLELRREMYDDLAENVSQAIGNIIGKRHDYRSPG